MRPFYVAQLMGELDPIDTHDFMVQVRGELRKHDCVFTRVTWHPEGKTTPLNPSRCVICVLVEGWVERPHLDDPLPPAWIFDPDTLE